MPTRAEVIANIDETIRDKTIIDKIDNVEDADNRELILDYIDQEVAGVPTTPDATDTVKGKIKLTGDLGGTAESPTVPALEDKQDVSNLSIDVETDGASDTKYPSVKAVKDYVDENAGGVSKTSGSITLTGTFQVLPFDVNSCAFSGGKAYLPTTTEVMKTIYVIAVANNIEIRANASGTNRMFEVFNTFTASVTLLTNEMYRFTYIDFGGYWKAEKI